jgi:DNA-binding transcriptional ArsR family regulator
VFTALPPRKREAVMMPGDTTPMSTPIYQVKAEFFKTLGHPARIRILEVLRDGERPVSELIPEVGIEASHLSQQLGIMRRANLIQVRKVGANVFYSVTEPLLFELLEVAKRIITASLTETQELLEQMQASGTGPSA